MQCCSIRALTGPIISHYFQCFDIIKIYLPMLIYLLRNCLKGSYEFAKKNISLCILCNAMCLCGLKFKIIIIFHILYIIVAPQCIAFLKHELSFFILQSSSF